MKWYLYIVKSKDDSLYTGISTNISRRIIEHNTKVGAKSLKGKIPLILAYKELYNSQAEAAKREREIKGWRRDKKEKLIKGLP